MQLEVNPGYATCPPIVGVRLSLARRRGVVGFLGGLLLRVYWYMGSVDGALCSRKFNTFSQARFDTALVLKRTIARVWALVPITVAGQPTSVKKIR